MITCSKRITVYSAAVAGFAAALMASTALAEPASLTIVHFNDLDRMEEDGGQGGIARLATVIKEIRAGGGNVIVTSGGDAISPSLMSGFDNGAHIIDLYNQLGIDVMAVGNHEFDFGPAVATERFNEAQFPMLSANAIDADGEIIDGAEATWTTQVGDYTIGFLGLTTVGTAVKSSPGTVTFASVEETAEATAAELRDAGADLVIALAHTDLGEDDALKAQAAVDIILSGDDHVLASFYDGRVALAESASQAEYVTVVDLTLDRVESRGRERFVWTPSFRTINTASVEPDPELSTAVQGYLDQLSKELDITVGVVATELDSRRASVRTQETAIGNLIADVMREAVEADIAITNGGGIRADRVYEPGTTLTRRDIQTELPFGNKTVLLELTGAAVVSSLENGFSAIEDVGGRFPQVSGLEVVYDASKAPGERVVSVTVGGEPLDESKVYTVATNDFMASGGDGYGDFAAAPQVIDAVAGRLMAAQVIEYIEQNTPVSPVVEGRIAQEN